MFRDALDAATMDDIAAAVSGDDPVAAINGRLAQLSALEDWVWDEQQKWRLALSIVEATEEPNR